MAKIVKGGMTFQSKEKLRNYIKFVLNNQDITKMLSGKWFDVVNDVLKDHEHYKQKVGEGTYQIGVTTCPVNPRNRHFYILREDGSSTDFSYYKALSTRSHTTDVKKALRDSVRDQAVSFKEEYFKNNAKGAYCICEETGLKVTKKTSHLDHYPKQFDELVADWLKDKGLKLADIELTPSRDNDVQDYLKDEALAKDFYDYHKENAKYRVVLSAVNMQRKKAKRTV